MRSHSRPIRIVAGVLATLLALTPVGTALASCAGADLGTSASPAAAETAVEQASMHHDCSGGDVRADDRTGVRSAEMRVPERTKTTLHVGVEAAPATAGSLLPISASASRPQPPDRSPTAGVSALRTVVLIV